MATPNLNLTLPTVGGSNGTWGQTLNDAFDDVDAVFSGTTGHDHDGTAGNGPKLRPVSLDTLSADGLVAADADGTFTARSIAGGAGIGVTNGNGLSGNPTVALDVDGLIAETAIVDADLVPLYDASVSAPRKATRTNFLKRALVTAPVFAVDVKGAVNGTVTCDTSAFSMFSFTPNGTCTVAFSNAPSSGIGSGIILEITNGGSFTVNWPASVDWPNGVAPSLSPAGTDVLVFITRDGGTTWRGVLSMQDSR